MTNSQKLLKKIMLYSGGIGVALGGLYLVSEAFNLGDTFLFLGLIAGLCGIVLAITFIAFLISLIVATSKGQ